MENKSTEQEQQQALRKTDVSSSANFFSDAQDFLKSQLPNDFEERLKDYAVNKGYNENEFRLFKSMLEESIGFYGTMVLLKHYC